MCRFIVTEVITVNFRNRQLIIFRFQFRRIIDNPINSSVINPQFRELLSSKIYKIFLIENSIKNDDYKVPFFYYRNYCTKTRVNISVEKRYCCSNQLFKSVISLLVIHLSLFTLVLKLKVKPHFVGLIDYSVFLVPPETCIHTETSPLSLRDCRISSLPGAYVQAYARFL